MATVIRTCLACNGGGIAEHDKPVTDFANGGSFWIGNVNDRCKCTI